MAAHHYDWQCTAMAVHRNSRFACGHCRPGLWSLEPPGLRAAIAAPAYGPWSSLLFSGSSSSSSCNARLWPRITTNCNARLRPCIATPSPSCGCRATLEQDATEQHITGQTRAGTDLNQHDGTPVYTNHPIEKPSLRLEPKLCLSRVSLALSFQSVRSRGPAHRTPNFGTTTALQHEKSLTRLFVWPPPPAGHTRRPPCHSELECKKAAPLPAVVSPLVGPPLSRGPHPTTTLPLRT